MQEILFTLRFDHVTFVFEGSDVTNGAMSPPASMIAGSNPGSCKIV